MAPSRALLQRIRLATVQLRIRSASHWTSTPLRTRRSTQLRSALRPAPSHSTRFPAFCARTYSQHAPAVEPPDYLNEAELHVFNKIKAQLEPAKLEVQDISGGCGSMYAIEIESPKFKGLTVIKQHKMVNEVLKEEIKSWHGVQLRTKPV